MNAPTTSPPHESLKAFGLGLLDDASAQALYRHLETCPACRRQAKAVSGDDFLLRLQRARDSHAMQALPEPKPAGRRGPQATYGKDRIDLKELAGQTDGCSR